jgi:hypothetical protein
VSVLPAKVKFFEHSILTEAHKARLEQDINDFLAAHDKIQVIGPVSVAFSDGRDRVISMLTYQEL